MATVWLGSGGPGELWLENVDDVVADVARRSDATWDTEQRETSCAQTSTEHAAPPHARGTPISTAGRVVDVTRTDYVSPSSHPP